MEKSEDRMKTWENGMKGEGIDKEKGGRYICGEERMRFRGKRTVRRRGNNVWRREAWREKSEDNL